MEGRVYMVRFWKVFLAFLRMGIYQHTVDLSFPTGPITFKNPKIEAVENVESGHATACLTTQC